MMPGSVAKSPRQGAFHFPYDAMAFTSEAGIEASDTRCASTIIDAALDR